MDKGMDASYLIPLKQYSIVKPSHKQISHTRFFQLQSSLFQNVTKNVAFNTIQRLYNNFPFVDGCTVAWLMIAEHFVACV
jgi:hypothetical protein